MPGRDEAVSGGWGEAVAARWAEAQGMIVLARNHCCRLGEVDLVLRDGGTLVFAEVKTRRSARWGSGLEAVSPRKRLRVVLAAQDWLWKSRIPPDAWPCRFDVVDVRPGSRGGGPFVRWVRDAYTLDGLLD